ncbi:polyketide cyclase [Streptomyces sp. G1]|uniref:polyketide cyclase n=1 Tax=Streptomyces sp. G1 TaxID=361572 RepID=UPI0020300C41|nr:polyketide cyclase [Streptomyces sp. G1]MCM1976979.1 polyketide cyclase [Streptomyces sp. G1]
MWEYEHGIETTAAPEAIWALWADVENWGTWNADIEEIELRGPFAAGAEITMTPAGQDPVELLVTEAVEGEMFVDEARFGGLVLRTAHRIERLGPALDPALSRVVYRMEISGEGAAEAGPEIGPAITADWPETMATLVRTAQG